MRFNTLGALVAAASVSSAFLLPPAISQVDTDIIKTLPFESAIAIDGRVMLIKCPGCPVMTNSEDKTHVTQVDSVLQLNFSVAHDPSGDGADRLMLNGHAIYPVDPTSAAFMEPLTASQLTKSAARNTWEQISTQTLGYSISVRRPVVSHQNQIDLVEIHLEIMEVANKFLTGIPSVEIKILETSSGKLMIGDATVIAPKSMSTSPTDGEQECTTMLCQWRAIIADRLTKIKGGCGKEASPTAKAEAPKPHHRRPGHRHPHGSHRPNRHHPHGGFSRFLRGIVLHILIPVLVGIMVGITASLVGMVVGQIAIFTWRLFFRRNRAQYTELQQQENADVEQETKSILVSQEPPPLYEDAVVSEKSSV